MGAPKRAGWQLSIRAGEVALSGFDRGWIQTWTRTGAYGSLLPAAWRSTGELEQWLGMLFMHHDGKPWEIFGKGGAQS